MQLSPVQRKFIAHWGEMGSRWGLNRSMAQIHALLYISPQALDAESIANALGIARSNVSMSLRELQGWGVVKVVHRLEDRRDRFESTSDVWEIFQMVLDERKKREIDPTLALLHECVRESDQSSSSDTHTRQRLLEMQEMLENVCTWYDQIRRLPRGAMIRFVKLGGKVPKLLGIAS